MQRDHLLNALKSVAPALANKDFIPAFFNVYFEGESLIAFNDFICLDHQFDSDFTGGLQGDLLIKFLSSANGAEVTINDLGDGTVIVSCGSAKLTTTRLDSDQFVYSMPGAGELAEVKIDDLSHYLKKSKLSISGDLTAPWRLGVTIAGVENLIHFFTCDRVSATDVFIKAGKTKLKPMHLSPAVCDMIIALDSDFLEVFDDGIALESGSLLVGARILSDIDVDQFTQMFGDVNDATADLLKGTDGQCIDTALVFGALERAQLVSNDGLTRFTVKDNVLTVETEGSSKMVDSVTVNHPDVEVQAPASIVSRAASQFKGFVILENSLVFLDDGVTHVVAVSS